MPFRNMMNRKLFVFDALRRPVFCVQATLDVNKAKNEMFG